MSRLELCDGGYDDEYDNADKKKRISLGQSMW